MQSKKRFWAALVIFSLVGQIAWVVENMYFNVFIYEMFNASETEISLMVMVSAIAATLTTVLVGALADKLGRRKIFIAGGYILWGVSILLFSLLRIDIISAVFPTAASAAAIGVTLVIVMDAVMTFFGSAANDAAFNAWLTDAADKSKRGAYEGINAMMPLVAILAVFGGFMAFDLGDPSSWTLIFLIIGSVVTAIGVAGFFLIEEPPVETGENQAYFKNIVYGFRPSVIKKSRGLYLSLVGFALFGISIQIFMPYLILYYSVSLALDSYVLVMAPAIILASVVTAFYGRIYDRLGYLRSLLPTLISLSLGYILLFFCTNVVLVFIGSFLMMCGYLSGTAVFGACIRDRIPENKSGMFQGLRIVAQVLIPGVVGPFIGASVLANADKIPNDDGTMSFVPNASIFLAALVAVLVLCLYLVAVYLIERRKKQNEAT